MFQMVEQIIASAKAYILAKTYIGSMSRKVGWKTTSATLSFLPVNILNLGDNAEAKWENSQVNECFLKGSLNGLG